MDVPTNAGTRGLAPAEPGGDRGRRGAERPGQPAARSARPPHSAGRRPVRRGDVRRHRRPGPQEADAGPVRPGQPRPAAARLLAGRVRPARLGARGLRADHLRVGQGARAHAVPRDGLAAAGGGRALRQRRVHRRRGVRPAGRHACASSTPSAGTGGNYAFYLSIPPKFFPTVVQQLKRSGLSDPGPARRGRARAVAAGGHREAVRPRPGNGARAERDRGRGLPGRVGVPDRPLPGQGDGPEHPGAALRQHALRAGLEPRLRRPRADHDVGGHRDRRPGRATTTASARPATSSRTTSCSCWR